MFYRSLQSVCSLGFIAVVRCSWNLSSVTILEIFAGNQIICWKTESFCSWRYLRCFLRVTCSPENTSYINIGCDPEIISKSCSSPCSYTTRSIWSIWSIWSIMLGITDWIYVVICSTWGETLAITVQELITGWYILTLTKRSSAAVVHVAFILLYICLLLSPTIPASIHVFLQLLAVPMVSSSKVQYITPSL